MLRKILLIIVVSLFAFGISKLSFAMVCGSKMPEAQAQEPTVVSQEEPVDVGNKICPVSGEKIDEKLKATYEYEGKIYNFCCPACVEEFKKEPEKYIKKVEEELKAQSKEETKEKIEQPSTMHEGHGEMHH